MLARMHPDFEWRPLEASPVARVYRGGEQVRRYVEDWITTFDVVRLHLDDPTELADRVVAMVRGRGRGRASGVELDTRFCQVWTVRCGMAVGMEEYATRQEALAAQRSGGAHMNATRVGTDTQKTMPRSAMSRAGRHRSDCRFARTSTPRLSETPALRPLRVPSISG
jgi:ketosteroid isomerase-like protein